MSRISSVLAALRAEGRKALIPYITAGDPAPGITVGLMHAMVQAGADIIELGVPFSDPMADGPVIQLACERALRHNVSLRNVLGMVREFRATNNTTPIVLMGYLNPVEAMGYSSFADAAADAGVDGVLTVDLPPEEADTLVPLLKARQLDAIFLLAPTTTDARIRQIAEHSSGYVYYVSLKGVTGSAQLNTVEVANRLAHIRSLISIPVGVGFGIRDAQTAAAIGAVADGVIVGSVLVNTIATHEATPDTLVESLTQILRPMREALDQLPR